MLKVVFVQRDEDESGEEGGDTTPKRDGKSSRNPQGVVGQLTSVGKRKGRHSREK